MNNDNTFQTIRSKSENNSEQITKQNYYNKTYDIITAQILFFIEKNNILQTDEEKKQNIYDLFDYLIIHKTSLSKFNESFRINLKNKIDYFIDANISQNDNEFFKKMKSIKFELTPYLVYSNLTDKLN
jgi:hypothetical protein